MGAITEMLAKVFADATLVFPLLVAATFAKDRDTNTVRK